jgi:tetrahydromethanopterin S-methyltransferase subunit B
LVEPNDVRIFTPNKKIKVMTVTIEISEEVKKVFLDNLNLTPKSMEIDEHEALLEGVIESYLNSFIDREDIDMMAGIYIDSIEESGELKDIIEELAKI